MTARRLIVFCDCGEPLRPDNRTGQCAECRLIARNERLLRQQAEQDAHRRAAVVAQKIRQLDLPGQMEADTHVPSAGEDQPTPERTLP